MKVRVEPTIKQFQAYEALRKPGGEKDPTNVVFFGGGAGGGKSWWLCESRLINCYLYPGYKSFLGRTELKRLMVTTYITWCKVCKYHRIPINDWHLDGKYSVIRFNNGSTIDLLDLAYQPRDPLYERFGSSEYTDGAIEECGEIHFDAYDVLKSRVNRHNNEKYGLHPSLAMTGNPKKNWTYQEFYKKSRNNTLPERHTFIQSLYSDNPHTSASYEMTLSGLSNLENRKRLKDGDWEYNDSPNALVEYAQISDLYSNSYVAAGKPAITCDVALMGADRLVIAVWSGFILESWTVIDKAQADEVEKKIRELAEKHKVTRSRIIYDGDGVGSFLSGYLRGAVEFRALHKPRGEDKKQYNTLKDQCGYHLANKINEGGIWIRDTKDKEIVIQELEQLQSYKIDDDKALRILPKPEIKKNIGRSPDFLDVLILRMALEVKEPGKLGITLIGTR